MKGIRILFALSFLIFGSFTLKADNQGINKKTKTIHIFVALCDNKYQGEGTRKNREWTGSRK